MRTVTPFSRVLAYAAFEARGFLRNGEQILVAIVLPALALLGLGVADIVSLELHGARPIDVVTPGVLALAIVSSSFVSQSIATAFDRRWGVLRQLSTTPLGAPGIVLGKVVATLSVQVIQVLVLSAIALGCGWRPDLAGLAPAFLGWIVGSVAFTSLGLIVASAMRAEAVLAVANLAWVIFAAVGGLILPPTATTLALGWTSWLPTGALGDLLRAALGSGAWAGSAFAVLGVWGIFLLAVAARRFRPSE